MQTLFLVVVVEITERLCRFKVRISEVLIYKEDLSAVDVSKLEGYLAHKWNLTNRLASGHAYASSAPTFDDPLAGVDLTLYWGSNDEARIC